MKKRAKELEVGNVLLVNHLKAKPTMIAEVDLSGQTIDIVRIRFADEENWYMLHTDKLMTIVGK